MRTIEGDILKDTRDLREENARLLQEIEALRRQAFEFHVKYSRNYMGNSIEYWYAKAVAYKNIVYEVCQAFRELGYEGDFGSTDTLAERLRSFTAALNKIVKKNA